MKAQAMKERKVARIEVWEIWIDPIQRTFARKVRGNISSRSAALKLKKQLQLSNPKRSFFLSPLWKTAKQIKAQRAFAKKMRGV